MTLKEMKQKALSLIEEYNPSHELLTDDPDIAAKLNSVINSVMYELARLKKIPKYVEMEVKKRDLVDFAAIEEVCGYEIYQIDKASGVDYETRADGCILKILESGTLELDVFVYPERITEKTSNGYEFELSPDALEIMPYGVAGDLLKSDVSAEYGNIYSTRYESMLQRLDPRQNMGMFTVEGGVYL